MAPAMDSNISTRIYGPEETNYCTAIVGHLAPTIQNVAQGVAQQHILYHLVSG